MLAEVKSGKSLLSLETLASWLLLFMALPTATYANPQGKQAYLADCARCHGSDGTGNSSRMHGVPGYVSVDLTKLSAANDWRFPR